MKNKHRREFMELGVKTLGFCFCAGGISSLLNSCEFYSEIQASSQGVTKVINIDTDIDYQANDMERDYFDFKGYGAKIRIPDVNYGVPLILVRKDPDTILCFSSLCTHDNCFGDEITAPSGYFDNPELAGYRLITCNCHGSHFDPWQDGKAIEGPAEKPLKQFKTEFDKNTNLLTIYF